MLMAYQWHLNGLFLYFSYFFHIFHSPSLSSCTSTATVTASAASAPWCPKTEKETHCNAYAMGGNQRKENGIKLPSNLKAMDWLCLCNPINLYQPAVSSNSRNWSMSSRTAHRSRLSTQSTQTTPCAKGLRSPNDAALKDPGDQWRTSGDLKDQRPKSHSVGYIDLFCLVHLVHLRLANMHSSNFAELVGYFFGSVLRPERRLDSAPSVPSLSGEFL